MLLGRLIKGRCTISLCALALMGMTVFGMATVHPSFAMEPRQDTFGSPDEAAAALVGASRAGDTKRLLSILGPAGKDLISSGDDVADKNARDRFVQAYMESNKITGEGDRKAVLHVGKDGWPFPIPIVKEGPVWRFDTRAGKEEILNRRVGRNELSAIEVCRAYVDAQKEYAVKDHDGDGLLEYAQQFVGDEGKKNGLYWPAKEGEEQSPLGPSVARAVKEGYGAKKSGDEPSPYHGYFYRILKAQGKNAPGGEYDYVVKGNMIGGFALVAYPAEYGVSGVKTFMVNHDGVVFEKDLGKATEKLASVMKKFNPDETWKKVE